MLVPRLVTEDVDAAGAFFADAVGRGHEGVVVKSPDAKYAAGRLREAQQANTDSHIGTLCLAFQGKLSLKTLAVARDGRHCQRSPAACVGHRAVVRFSVTHETLRAQKVIFAAICACRGGSVNVYLP